MTNKNPLHPFVILSGLCTLLLSWKSFAIEANYQLTWLKKEQILTVNACISTTKNLILDNQDRELSRALISASHAGKNVKNGDFNIRFNPDNGNCLDYIVSLNSKGRWPFLFENSSLVLPTALWFWSHDEIDSTSFSVFAETGNHISAHFPWPYRNGSYNTNTTSRYWTSRTLIGDISSHSIIFNADRKLNVTLMGSTKKRTKEWLSWLQQTGSAIEMAFAQLPVPRANILVMPANSGKSAVPWGEVQRGGLPSVHFFINANKPLSEFQKDWTASHEFSHLFAPKISWRDRWLSEGIASYYQNVLRARSGILTKEAAWRKLKEGLARGRRDFNGRSLRRANKTMHLYWGGVAIYFLADLQLRDKGSSLDETLQKLSNCCLGGNKTWSAEQYMKKLDELSNTQIFRKLLRNEANARQFPVLESFESDSNPLLKRHLHAILTGE